MLKCAKFVSLIAIPMALALVSCESDCNTSEVNCRISKENFEKLSQGMPLQEVDSILGADNALRYAEESNSGLGSVLENQCVGKRWIRCRGVCEDGNAEITVCIDHDTLQEKRFRKFP